MSRNRAPQGVPNPAPEPAAQVAPVRGQTLETALSQEIGSFTFEQAVRLLRLLGDSGQAGEPSVRFETGPYRTHPAAALSPPQRREADADGRQAVTFHGFGLTGANGAMPAAYSEDVAAWWSQDHEAPLAFLDIFNDRLIALYYKAWAVNQIGLRYEGDDADAPERLRPTDALMGLGLWELISRVAPDAGDFGRGTFRFFTGALAAEGRSVATLTQILRAVLVLPIRVEPFSGKWLRLPEAQRARLLGRRGGMPLGARSQMLGSRAFSAPAGVRIVLGPMSRADFGRFLPSVDQREEVHGAALAELAAFVRFFLGPTIDFEIQPLLDPAEAGPAELGRRPSERRVRGGNRLGMEAFLRGRAVPAGPRFRFSTRD